MAINYTTMSDAELTAELHRIYAEEAEGFNTTVEAMFDMPALIAWFRAGFPDEIEGMSSGMVKLAKLALIEKGLLA